MNRSLEIIRTQFWIRSLLKCFGFDSVNELIKLSNKSIFKKKSKFDKSEDFFSSVEHVIPVEEDARKAYELLVLSPLEPSNWYAYFNGKQPITAKSGQGVSKVEGFSEVFPETMAVYKNGPYNLIAILECNFVATAVEMFSYAVEDFHDEHCLDYSSHSRSLKGPYDRDFSWMITKHEPRQGFDLNFESGNFERAMKYFSCLVTRLYPTPYWLDNNPNDFLILELAEKIIRANFFGGNFKSLAREVGLTLETDLKSSICNPSFTHCLHYLREEYGIEKQLWIDAFPIFKYAHIFWCRNEETLSEHNLPFDADPWYN
ncbi:hypothetical protein FORC36_0145 [Vibrio vulnificus]|uniref:hypothetical protein n=1 Tax=Vibrio vulnificus TaxID=672 RepID=UPI000A20297A|nr:hypothetical protein [Vibrio vulnificus]ARN64662.1 hypothetical protein FORC36_0145 [Vibrio vulnificus]